MSAIPPAPDAGGETNRVRCAYCGANNFPTAAMCWQCGRPLQPLRAGSAAPLGGGGGGLASPGAWPTPPTAPALARPFTGVRPSLAPKAAAALGLLFPWAGLPLGLTFLMLDDPRKVQLGWITIGWSIVGTVLNGLAVLLPLATLWPVVKSLLSHPTAGGGGSIPGMPSLGGGEENFLFSCIFSVFRRP